MVDLSLDLYNLRGMGVIPRVHGNGFIQIDLDDIRRLHIWGHKDIPRQKISSPIHDHIFNFTSYALVGKIVNVNYQLVRHTAGQWYMYHPVVRNQEDTILEKMDSWRWATWPQGFSFVDAASPFPVSRSYYMPAGVFHEIFTPEPAATIMFKEGYTHAQGNDLVLPRVLVPFNEEPDNNFDRYGFDEDKLWDITFEVLKGRP